MEEYIYFVSISHSGGFANIEIYQDRPITNFEHILSIQKLAADEYGVENPVVISYQLLSHGKQ